MSWLLPMRALVAPSAPDHPAGRLSGLRVGDRVLQIQTELFTRLSEPRIVTVVMLGGRTLHRRSRPAPRAACREELHRLVVAQHAELEREVSARLRDRAARLRGGPPGVARQAP